MVTRCRQLVGHRTMEINRYKSCDDIAGSVGIKRHIAGLSAELKHTDDDVDRQIKEMLLSRQKVKFLEGIKVLTRPPWLWC
jgi:transposase